MHSKVKTPAAQQKIQQIAKDAPGATDIDDQTAVDTGAMANEPKQAAAPPPTVEKPMPQPIVIPAGTVLTVKVGQALSFTVSAPLTIKPAAQWRLRQLRSMSITGCSCNIGSSCARAAFHTFQGG